MTPLASAQTNEQYFPSLVYRTGAYAPNGVPFANGYADYLKLTNARGGINGVKVSFEECETGYATDRGVECYERLKGKNGGATVFQPLSTGITFALTEKAPVDKIPLITAGYGRSESADGGVFKWNFPIVGTYWVAADIADPAHRQEGRRLAKLKGKKIAVDYHDSPYRQGADPHCLQERAAMLGFTLQLAARCRILASNKRPPGCRCVSNRPDYVLVVGLGRDERAPPSRRRRLPVTRARRCIGTWWSGAEPDVKDVGAGAKGYNAITMQHGAETDSAVVKEILTEGACQGRRYRSEGRGRLRCCTCVV